MNSGTEETHHTGGILKSNEVRSSLKAMPEGTPINHALKNQPSGISLERFASKALDEGRSAQNLGTG